MERSEQINELAEALCAAQGDFPNVPKDANNPFFKSKYADLASIVDTVRPVLKKHGLSFSQLTGMDATVPVITTMLLHKSGQFIASTLPMPASKVDAQGIGSAITYGRRYGLQAILGLAAEDDDGNAASGNHQQEQPRKQSKPELKPEKVEPTTNIKPEPQKLDILWVGIEQQGKNNKKFFDMGIVPVQGLDLAYCFDVSLLPKFKALEGHSVKCEGKWGAKGFFIEKLMEV